MDQDTQREIPMSEQLDALDALALEVIKRRPRVRECEERTVTTTTCHVMPMAFVTTTTKESVKTWYRPTEDAAH